MKLRKHHNAWNPEPSHLNYHFVLSSFYPSIHISHNFLLHQSAAATVAGFDCFGGLDLEFVVFVSAGGLVSHVFLDLASHGHEGLLHIGRVLG